MGRVALPRYGAVPEVYTESDCEISESLIKFPPGVTWKDIDIIFAVGDSIESFAMYAHKMRGENRYKVARGRITNFHSAEESDTQMYFDTGYARFVHISLKA